jgi:hypothetical protein
VARSAPRPMSPCASVCPSSASILRKT